MTSRGILIVGPPRSGTSAVAGMLNEAGVFMGRRLVPPGTNNPRGHFEDLDFQLVNERAMGGFYTPRNVVTECELAMWRLLVRDRESELALWCVKDPRLCFTAQYILPFMSDPRVIVCIRDKRVIVDSFTKMAQDDGEDLNREEVDLLIDKYILSLNALMDGIGQSYPYCMVGYDYVVDHPEEALDELLDFVLPKEYALSFISPRLRHHTCDS